MDDDPSWPTTSPVMRTVAKIIAKEPGILAGQPVLNYLFTKNCRHPNLKWNISEGDEFQVGDAILTIEADGAEILSVERTAMNLITRMSGIATKTSRWVKILDEVAIAATRKTLWGVLDKWAVHAGGGLTHRLSRAPCTQACTRSGHSRATTRQISRDLRLPKGRPQTSTRNTGRASRGPQDCSGHGLASGFPSNYKGLLSLQHARQPCTA